MTETARAKSTTGAALDQIAEGRNQPFLGDVGFFADIAPSTVAELDRRCRWHNLQAGEVLLAAGARPDRVYFAHRGELRSLIYTRMGRIVSLPRAPEGGLLEGTCLGGGGGIPFSIEAARKSTAVSIDATALLSCAERNHILLGKLFRAVIENRDLCIQQIVELSTLSARARILAELTRICGAYQNPDGSATIVNPPTQVDLANRVASQREVVSRELSQLESLGVIERRGGILYVPSVSRLATLQGWDQEPYEI